MADRRYHIAQVNIARARAPLDDPLMRGFVEQLEALNRLAEGSPGFVWRLQTEEGDATSLRVYDDPSMMINLTVWESIEALHAFSYGGDHVRVYAERNQWFETLDTPSLALWWVDAGHIPTTEEAKGRLELLAERGPTPDAFAFKHRFPVP